MQVKDTASQKSVPVNQIWNAPYFKQSFQLFDRITKYDPHYTLAYLNEADYYDSLANFLLQNNFSLSFIENIQYCAPFFYSANGVSIIDSADVMSQFMGLRHSATYQLGNFLMVLSNYIHLPLVSDPSTLYPDTNKSSKDFYKAKNFNSKTSFYRYYNNNISYKQNLLKYIECNNVNYVVASSHFKTFYYFDTVKVKRIIKDKNTGYQLILFKNAK